MRRPFFVLLPTFECNLACSYCFADRSPGRWTITQALNVASQAIAWAKAGGFDSMQIHWQGGEPMLLGVEYWSQVLPEVARIAEGHGLAVRQAMQSNLVSYSREFGELARRHLGGRVGTSFEPVPGRRFAGRSAEQGAGAASPDARFSERWLEAFRQAEADGVRVGVLCLLSDELLSMGAARVLRIFREELLVRRLRFTLPFRTQGRGVLIDPIQAGAFLADAYRIWREAGSDSWLRIKPFAFLEAALRNAPSKESGYCDAAPCCADIAACIQPSGDVTLCDSFGPSEEGFIYGNVFVHGLGAALASPARRRVRGMISDLLSTECTGCECLRVCFGGCLRRAVSRPTVGPRYHYCETTRALAGAILDQSPSPRCSSQ